jgi:hypothetical protein
VCSVDLTTRLGREDSAPAQHFNDPQQLAQADQAELRITPQLLALAPTVDICPTPRELHRGTIGKPHDQHGLAR